MNAYLDLLIFLALPIVTPAASLIWVCWERAVPYRLMSILDRTPEKSRSDIEWRLLASRWRSFIDKPGRLHLIRLMSQFRRILAAYVSFKGKDIYGKCDLFASGVAALIVLFLAAGQIWEFVTKQTIGGT